MQIFFSLLKTIFLFVLLMIPGFILGKRNRITDGGMDTLSNLLTDIAMPFLVFSKLLQIDLGSLKLSSVLCSIFLPAAVIFLVYFLTIAVFPAKEDRSRYPVNRFCSMMPNCGFIGIPLAAATFPDVPEITLYVSVVNVVSTYILLTLGLYVLSGEKKDISARKLLTSPVLFAIILGLGGSLLPDTVITFAYDYSVLLAQLATPLSMLVLGFRLSRLPLSGVLKNREMYMTVGVKLVVMPLLMILLLLGLQICRFPVDYPLAMAMFIVTAVSTAGSAPALAHRYGLNSEHAAALTIGTSVCSVATIPVLSMLVELFF